MKETQELIKKWKENNELIGTFDFCPIKEGELIYQAKGMLIILKKWLKQVEDEIEDKLEKLKQKTGEEQ